MSNKRKLGIDKDYTSSPIWEDGLNLDIDKLNLSENSLYWLDMYDNLWEQVMTRSFLEDDETNEEWIVKLQLQVAAIVQKEHPEYDIYPKKKLSYE